MTRYVSKLIVVLAITNLLGCTAVAIVDTAVGAAVGVSKVAIKGTVAVADAAIPDGDDEEAE